ncbi:MAG TPA: SPOR domain-containing protein [Cyclobacteriaceae bacterium]
MTLFLLQASCAAQQTGNKLAGDLYHENLTLVRPKYEVKEIDSLNNNLNTDIKAPNVGPTYTVNAKVDMVLDSLDKLNQLKRFIDGFTVQIYSGPNREDALGAKAKMVKEMSNLEASIQYTQPKFRVTAGRYFTKLEAQKDLMQLRIFFPNAILVPEKIMIK